MKNTKTLFGVCLSALLTLGSVTGCKGNSAKDKYDKQGRLYINLKNVYFDQWDGSDTYTEEINNKFGVHVVPTNYDYAGWDGMVNTAINGNNLTDTIQFNLKAYNFGSTYEKWVDDMMIKPLPDDMSKWPNLQEMLSHVSNIDALKIDGKLYGIPIMNDIVNYQKDFSNFTYVYRRDWAKAIDKKNAGKSGYEPIYKEGDVYTWEEFNRLVAAFQANPDPLSDSSSKMTTVPLVDERWAFPSITNFYKDAPHCFSKDSAGKAICNFTSDSYIPGLEKSKDYVSNNYYSKDQFNFQDNKANELYIGGQAGILYDNFSLSNYIKLRKALRKAPNGVDDATAIMRIKGPDGKFALEGTENWFSMTMFNYDISEKKQHKILDVLDFLLSKEGTMLAIYGKEGYDYSIVNGEVVLSEKGWEKDINTGTYAPKINGAKYLRYMATLGNDTKSYDPFTDMDAFNVLNEWMEEMKEAKAGNKLRVIQEPADISWMSTKTKNDKTEGLLDDANTDAMKYAFGKYSSIDAYKDRFNTNNWKKVLEEINAKLGFQFMSNKVNKIIALSLLVSCVGVVTGCNEKKDLNNMVFTKKNIVLNNFEGLGVEWGTYEDPDKLSTGSWERSLKIMDRLNPSVTRCMLNYDWFITSFDDKNDSDKTNDTWEYNFANKYMNNTVDILKYCDDHNIEVAFGCWNVPGSLGQDEYDMFTEVTSDIRWAKMTADVIEYLVKFQGIRCIKYFVNSNEPNYSGVEGRSKNFKNNFNVWSQGVKNVRAALDERGFKDIKIVGGDTTGFEGTDEYFTGISKDKELRSKVGDYGFHVYCPNMIIDTGDLAVRIKDMYKKTKKNDKELGTVRMPHIWEAGLFDGKDQATDSNAYIANYSYGLRMADYTLQCAIAGVNAIVYWDFDDGMHFIYHEDGTTNSKGWGMFSSLNTDSAIKQKLRPWYHSSTLLTNLMMRGSQIIDSGVNDPKYGVDFRSMGVIGPNKDYAGVVAINRGMENITKTFRIAEDFNDSKKVYVYVYNENELQLGEDGFVKYNKVMELSLKDQIELTIPHDTMMILSSKEL